MFRVKAKSGAFALLIKFTAAAAIAAAPAGAAHGALPRFLGGSGVGVGGNRGNIADKYPTFWDMLMRQQSYVNMRRGMYEMAAYKYEDAAQSFAKAVVKNPDEAAPHILLGMALYWQGRVDGAMAEYRAALEIKPESDDARQLLGIAYAWKGDINAALEEFLQAVQANPKRADAQMNIGSAYAALGRMDEALYRFRNAAALDKRHPLYQYQLGSIYERLGRDAPAEEAFKKAISLYPRYEEAMLALAVLYEKMGKNTPAEVQYKKALKLKPGDSVARLRLASLLARQGRRNEAVEIISRAFLISPASEEGLGLSLYYNGSGGGSRQQQQPGPEQLERFKERLLKAPAARRLRIEVEMSLLPKFEPAKVEPAQKRGDFAAPAARPPAKPSALAAAVEEQDKQAATLTFSRTFILAAATEEERKEQLERITGDFRSVILAAGEKYDINMSIRAAPAADGIAGGGGDGLGPTSVMGAGGRAGYNPYMVGNDMGLWTPNKNWVAYIEEIMPDVLARLAADPRDYLVAGLAYITLGKGVAALENFTRAQELAAGLSAGDALKLLPVIKLGAGTARVVLGDEAAALEDYKAALALSPDNDIAKADIAVLEEK